MSDRPRWRKSLIIAAAVLALAVTAVTGLAYADGRPLYLPLTMKPATGPLVQVRGRVFLQGRDDHTGATLYVGRVPVAQTRPDGSFSFTYYLPASDTAQLKIVAACRAYLWAETTLSIDGRTVFELPDVCLLGGDVAGPDSVAVTPPAGCPSTEPVQVPGPADGIVNIFDLTLISTHEGKSSGDPEWGPDPCRPGVPYLAHRADVNGDGQVDPRDYAIALQNVGKTAPLPWVPCSE